jgi:hypothetical protein
VRHYKPKHNTEFSNDDIAAIIHELQENGSLQEYQNGAKNIAACHVMGARKDLCRALADVMSGVDKNGEQPSFLVALDQLKPLRRALVEVMDAERDKDGFPAHSDPKGIASGQARKEFQVIEDAVREKIKNLAPSRVIIANQQREKGRSF